MTAYSNLTNYIYYFLLLFYFRIAFKCYAELHILSCRAACVPFPAKSFDSAIFRPLSSEGEKTL